MHVLRRECAAEEKDRLVAEFYELGASGILEDELPGGRSLLRAFFEERFESGALGGEWEEAETRDWVEVARAQWTPVLVGERFFLAPEWSAEPAPPGRIRLEMQPGLACGTGWGPATQLALEAMERTVGPGAAVLDLGTGSGILAVAAARLGAGPVWACDIDFEATGIARGRCLREAVAVDLFCGSARAMRDAAADVVLANINAAVLTSLAHELRRVLRPGGRLVLSGFTERHLAPIAAALGPLREVFAREEWRAVIG